MNFRMRHFFLIPLLCCLPAWSALAQEKSAPPLSDEAKQTLAKGMSQFQKGGLDEAAASFRKFLQLAPDNPNGLINLGVIEFRLNHPGEAQSLLEKGARIDPDSETAWLTLGIIYYNAKQLDAALAALARAVMLKPSDATAHNFLAITVGAKGWRDGAESELEKAIELKPDYAEAHFNLAISYLRHSPPAVELARRHYQQALDLGESPDPLVEKMLQGVTK